MNKQDFLVQLRNGFSGLPANELDERLTFYSEMIDDSMEEGMSEEEAVAAIGSIDEILTSAIPDSTLPKKATPKRHLAPWEILLLALGSPIWLSLLISAFAVIFSVYIVLWSTVVSLWAVFGALAGCTICGILVGTYFLFIHTAPGAALIAAGLICGGLSIFLLFGCKGTTKAFALLTKKIFIWLKNRIRRKEVMQ